MSLVLTVFSVHALESELLALIQGKEAAIAGRIGVKVNAVGSDLTWQYNSQQRFPMASTFKPVACAALLAKVDAGQEDLDRRIVFAKTDVVTYSPVTEQHTGAQGMSLSALCEAAITMSDNTAANLVLAAIDGPQGLTQFIRAVGDEVTRLDRWETELNEATPGDERDTTTPDAMADLLQKLLFSNVLSARSRDILEQWLRGNKVGDALLRAGIPADWEIGDKTGAGGYGTRGIAAVIWPPDHPPLVVAIYITQTSAPLAERNKVIADIGEAIANAVLQRKDSTNEATPQRH